MPNSTDTIYCRWCAKPFPSRLSLQRHVGRARSCGIKQWNHLAALSTKAHREQPLNLRIPASARAPRQTSITEQLGSNTSSAPRGTSGAGTSVCQPHVPIESEEDAVDVRRAGMQAGDTSGGAEMEWEPNEPQGNEGGGRGLEADGNLAPARNEHVPVSQFQ